MIKVEGVNKTFVLGDSQVHALNDVSIDIQAGEYVSVMGSSGSGKSTFLNMLGLLDRPDSGHYHLNGVDTITLGETERARVRREEIGFVFQSYHLIARLSARENVEMPLILTGVAPRKRRVLVDDILRRLGIFERAHHLPNQLSGGERQRVAIGRSIIMQPSILLADEPTGNLDSKSGGEVTDILEALNHDGLTLLVVTHDHDMGQRARRQIRMGDGKIISDKHDGIEHIHAAG